MKLACEQEYPGFTRNIYLRAYRYNLHLMPKSLLIEAGAQTNTVEEMMNAMEVLSDSSLSGSDWKMNALALEKRRKIPV